MDVLGGLGVLGKFINGRQEKMELEKKVPLKRKPENIYNNGKNKLIKKKWQEKATNRTKASLNPKKTGIIPKQYNNMKALKKKNQYRKLNTFSSASSDSVFSDDYEEEMGCCPEAEMSDQSNVSSLNMHNPLLMVDKCQKFIDNRKHERKFVQKTQDDNNFLEQFEPMKFDNNGPPSSQNAVHKGNGMDTVIQRMEAERALGAEAFGNQGGFTNFGETNDMTYGVTAPENFTHNNMKPNFKSKSAAGPLRQEHAGETHQRKMELFSGSTNADRPDWQHKKEQAPLFHPAANIENIYGMPSMTDYMESRYIPSKTRNNEKPFQPIKVTSGLGLGANGDATFTKGGGDLYRVLPKTVDDLRPLSRPKITYEGVTVQGQKGNRGRLHGRQVQQRQVVKFKENQPGEYRKTFNSQLQAPKIIGEVDPTTMGGANRGIHNNCYVGPSKHEVSKVTTDELRGKYRTAFKENYDHAEPRNVQLIEGLRTKSQNYNTWIPGPTQRGKEEKYVGPAGKSETGKTYAFDTDNAIPDTNMRTEHMTTDRAGKAMTGDLQKTQYFDPSDVTDNNMRNIHEKTDRSGKAVTGDYDQARYINFGDVPDENMRGVHAKTDRSGKALTGDREQVRYINYGDVPDENMRGVHAKTDRSGKAVTGDREQVRYINYSDVPDENMRGVHAKTDRSGKAVTGDREQVRYINYGDVPDENMRGVHAKTDRSGKAVTGDREQVRYINYSDVPDENMRGIHAKTDRSGKAVTGDREQVRYINYGDVPDENMRGVHAKTDRSGKAVTGDREQVRYINYSDVPDENMRGIHAKTDRSGKAITGDREQARYINYGDVPDENMRGIHAKTDRSGKAITGDREQARYINYGDVPDENMRGIHAKTDRSGKAITGDREQARYINYGDVPDENMRGIHAKTDRSGKAVTGDREQVRYINYSDVPDENMRGIHAKTDRSGKAITGDREQARYINYGDVPDENMRGIHAKTDRSGKAITGDREQARYINFNDVPDENMRTIHDKTDRSGKAVTGDREQVRYINFKDVPDQTMREMTGETNWTGPGKYVYADGPRNRRDALNSKVNVTREVVAKGRMPTLVGENRGPTTGFTEYRFRDPEQSNYINHAGLLNQTVDKMPFKMENVKNPTWYNNTRLTNVPENNLQKNPYINNMVHKAIIKF
jgi:hypothetical protein